MIRKKYRENKGTKSRKERKSVNWQKKAATDGHAPTLMSAPDDYSQLQKETNPAPFVRQQIGTDEENMVQLVTQNHRFLYFKQIQLIRVNHPVSVSNSIFPTGNTCVITG